MSISCVICGRKLDRAGVCPRCGCDLSQCRERYPTLADDGHTPPSISAILSQRFEQLSAAQAAAQAAIVQREIAQSNERQPDAAPSSAAAYSVRQSEATAPNAVEHDVHDPKATASPAVNPRTGKGRAKAFLLAAAAVLILVLGGVFLLPKLTESRTLLGSGTCGEAVTWELYDDGRLIINGSGEMTSSPWTQDEYRDRVVKAKISSGVTGIGGGAFVFCHGLSLITIPDSVTNIGPHAFSGCTSLRSITISDSVTSIGEAAFSDCTSLRSITIPNSVTSIESWAFSGCTSLRSITIPDSVINIGEGDFYCCNSLTGISVSKDNPSYCDLDGVLFSKSKEELIAFPTGRGGEYAVPDSVTSISNYAFPKCSGLSSITIPNSVTSIGRDAFSYCNGLSSVTIPDSVTRIEVLTFYGCRGLNSITIPDSVTSIGHQAFSGCTSLSSITIPDSVTNIGNYAFFDTSLTDVYYRGTQEQWSKISIGDGNSELTNADIHYNSN